MRLCCVGETVKYDVGPLLHTPITTGNVVYLARQGEDGPIKIGESYDVTGRVRNLSYGSSRALELLDTIPGDRSLEMGIQAHFKNSRIDGEWFSPSDALVLFVIMVRGRLDPSEVPDGFASVKSTRISRDDLKYLDALRQIQYPDWFSRIRGELEKTGGNVYETARNMGVASGSVYRWIRLDPKLADGLSYKARPQRRKMPR